MGQLQALTPVQIGPIGPELLLDDDELLLEEEEEVPADELLLDEELLLLDNEVLDDELLLEEAEVLLDDELLLDEEEVLLDDEELLDDELGIAFILNEASSFSDECFLGDADASSLRHSHAEPAFQCTSFPATPQRNESPGPVRLNHHPSNNRLDRTIRKSNFEHRRRPGRVNIN